MASRCIFTVIAYINSSQAEIQSQYPSASTRTASIKHTYPQTITVLQLLYSGEVYAHALYLEFSSIALREGHKNIAYLFKALAESEAVHASNFKRILMSTGVQVKEVDLTSMQTFTTKENLKYAVEVELAEIDIKYRRHLQRIKPEKHQEALKYIKYAWRAEQQHRELIKQIESGTGIFFRVLLKRFRTQSNTYYVNQNCGATVTQRPKNQCPICHKPLKTYLQVSKP